LFPTDERIDELLAVIRTPGPTPDPLDRQRAMETLRLIAEPPIAGKNTAAEMRAAAQARRSSRRVGRAR
jgi:hypothetical protein